MRLFKEVAIEFGKSVMAGWIISFGASMFLLVESRIFSSLLFSLGMVVVCNLDLNLYTGRVGFLLDNHSPKYLRTVLMAWGGNLIGIWLSALLLQTTRQLGNLQTAAQALVDTKSGDSLLSLFVLGIYCGMLMYLTVALFRRGKSSGVYLTGYIGIFLCIAVFIQCGFEHSIADMFYYCVTNSMGIGRSWLVLLMVSLGNAAGAMLIRAGDYFLIDTVPLIPLG